VLGFFIVFEGVDGVGKSTVISKVKNELVKIGYSVYTTSEPSTSPIGNLLRQLLRERNVKPELYAILFTADRYYHYYYEILPALKSYDFVLCERYVESTICYQTIQGLSTSWLEELNRHVPRPDLTIILDASIDVISERLRSREDLEVFERDISFLERVRSLMLSRAREKNYIIINTSHRDVNDVVQEVLKHILTYSSSRSDT